MDDKALEERLRRVAHRERTAQAISYLGKYVRTEDRTRHNCGELKSEGFNACDEYCGPDDVYGFMGKVTKVHVDTDSVIMFTDEGVGVPLYSTTAVMVYTEDEFNELLRAAAVRVNEHRYAVGNDAQWREG